MNLKNGYIGLIVFLFLESLFPIFTYFAMKNMQALYVIAFSVLVAMLFGLIIFVKEKLYKQYLQKELLFPTFMSAFFLGVGGVLYFFGIKYSSPSIAAILLLLQTFFAFIAFNLIGKEDYNYKQIIGAILMFLGGFIILYDGKSFINLGALIMIFACIFWTIGNFFTKKASLKGANPFFLLINRNFLMFFSTLILAYIFIGKPDLELVKQNFIWIFIIGFLVLFISKTIWIWTLSKLNGFIAISSFPIIPLLVMIFSYFILGEIPTFRQVLGFIPIFIGSYLLIKK